MKLSVCCVLLCHHRLRMKEAWNVKFGTFMFMYNVVSLNQLDLYWVRKWLDFIFLRLEHGVG